MHAYDMRFDWADLSSVPEAVNSWAHNGIVVKAAGELIGFHAGRLMTFDRSGHLSKSLKTGLTEGHGITLVREGDDEFLWVSDPGFVFEVGLDDGDEAWEVVFGKGVRGEIASTQSRQADPRRRDRRRTSHPAPGARIIAGHDGRLLPVQYGSGRGEVQRQR